MIAEENCALGEHETRNMVCCAKHHLEIPCDVCVQKEKDIKEAAVKKVDPVNKDSTS